MFDEPPKHYIGISSTEDPVVTRVFRLAAGRRKDERDADIAVGRLSTEGRCAISFIQVEFISGRSSYGSLRCVSICDICVKYICGSKRSEFGRTRASPRRPPPSTVLPLLVLRSASNASSHRQGQDYNLPPKTMPKTLICFFKRLCVYSLENRMCYLLCGARLSPLRFLIHVHTASVDSRRLHARGRRTRATQGRGPGCGPRDHSAVPL